MIYIKTKYQIEQIKKACEIWKLVKKEIIDFSQIGKSLIEIDKFAKTLEKKYNFVYTFFGYNDFPNNLCISVNDTVIHGVCTDYILKNKDLVTFDIGITYNNYVCDAAFTIILGEVTDQTKKINDICFNSLLKGIDKIKPNNKVGDISSSIQQYVESNGFKVIKNFGGHGCGIKLHEDPIILNYGKENTGPTLLPNMVLCIEPMILTDSDQYFIDKDNWSVKASNHLLTCHWEHMVLVTETGYEILT